MYKLIFERDRLYLYPWYFADEALTFDIEKIFGKRVPPIVKIIKRANGNNKN